MGRSHTDPPEPEGQKDPPLEPLQGARPADTLASDTWPPALCEDIVLLLYTPSVWHFVTAAPEPDSRGHRDGHTLIHVQQESPGNPEAREASYDPGELEHPYPCPSSRHAGLRPTSLECAENPGVGGKPGPLQ